MNRRHGGPTRCWDSGMRMLGVGPTATLAIVAMAVVHVSAQQPFPLPPLVIVHPIDPPASPLPSETASASQTRFSFIAYGDTRSQVDGQSLQPEHGAVVD